MEYVLVVLVVIVLLVVYLAPTTIVVRRNKRTPLEQGWVVGVIAANLMLGWTGLGWLLCLLGALFAPVKGRIPVPKIKYNYNVKIPHDQVTYDAYGRPVNPPGQYPPPYQNPPRQPYQYSPKQQYPPRYQPPAAS